MMWSSSSCSRRPYAGTQETFEKPSNLSLLSRQASPQLTRWSQVTHYYFDDCIYYTPAFSDETVGKLQLRDLSSIQDGQPRPNSFLGERFDPPAISPAPKRKTLKHVWKRFINR
jgi:hypothetical protein